MAAPPEGKLERAFGVVRSMNLTNVLILALIVMPLIIPALIFGSGAVTDTIDSMDRSGFLFLAAFSVAAVALSPFAAAAAVRLNLAG